MDVVIPFQHSINRDEELRYALRSMEAWFTGAVDHVYIIGDAPRWEHQNLRHVPMPNRPQVWYRDFNQFVKIAAGCELSTSDQILILHDDNFLLSPFSPDTYYHQGHTWNGSGDYAKTEANTRFLFADPIFNYDVHAPHVVNRKLFLDIVGRLDWMRPYGYCIKTVYGATLDLPGVYHDDRKFGAAWATDYLERETDGRAFFSISDTAWKGDVIKFIKRLYPEESRYEKS
jgi:hypothetical protein